MRRAGEGGIGIAVAEGAVADDVRSERRVQERRWQLQNYVQALHQIREPLHRTVWEILAELPRAAGQVFVLPAARGAGHFVGLQKFWTCARTRAGLPDVRLHDFRHSFASVGVGLNQSLFIVGKILGHTRAATTERYSHLALDPVRAAAEQSSRQLANALKGHGAANVVRLKRARK